MSVVGVFHVAMNTMCEDVPTTINLYYRRSSGAPATYQALDLADCWKTNVWPSIHPMLASVVILMRIVVRPLLASEGNPYEANYTEAEHGTGAAEPLPPSVAALLKLKCVSPSSRNNGHIYLAGCPESAWVNGAWTGAFITLSATLGAILRSSLPASAAGVVYSPVVVNRYAAGVKLVPPQTFDMDDVTLSTRISQQRRRQSGQQGIKA